MDFFYVFENLISHKAEILATLGGIGGVYMFVNCVNGKSYVGSTVNFRSRFNDHYYGYRSNKVLQNAFTKYGKEKFSFIILAIVPPIKWLLLFLEQLALDHIKPAYNFLTVAGSSLGYVRSEEHNAKLSKCLYQYSTDYTLVNQFPSISAAALSLNIRRATLYNYIDTGRIFRESFILTTSKRLLRSRRGQKRLTP
jgi:hypothetical protein